MASLDIDRLFTQHAHALYGFLSYRVGDPTVAEDLLGDTFERVVRSRQRFDSKKGSETTWIYAIALNCLRDHVRRAHVERDAHERARPAPGEATNGALDRVEDRDMVVRALECLDPAEREVLALRYGADLRLEDIAAVIGLPATTVNGRLYSGLRKLRAAIEPDQTSLERLGSRSQTKA